MLSISASGYVQIMLHLDSPDKVCGHILYLRIRPKKHFVAQTFTSLWRVDDALVSLIIILAELHLVHLFEYFEIDIDYIFRKPSPMQHTQQISSGQVLLHVLVNFTELKRKFINIPWIL